MGRRSTVAENAEERAHMVEAVPVGIFIAAAKSFPT